MKPLNDYKADLTDVRVVLKFENGAEWQFKDLYELSACLDWYLEQE